MTFNVKITANMRSLLCYTASRGVHCISPMAAAAKGRYDDNMIDVIVVGVV